MHHDRLAERPVEKLPIRLVRGKKACLPEFANPRRGERSVGAESGRNRDREHGGELRNGFGPRQHLPDRLLLHILEERGAAGRRLELLERIRKERAERLFTRLHVGKGNTEISLDREGQLE